MAQVDSLEDKIVVLIGGGGFLGSHVAEVLLRRGARVRIAERHPEQAYHLRALANLGQIQFLRANVRDKHSLDAATRGADAVVYLVGTFGDAQFELQAEGAGEAAKAAAANGAKAFVYISALGADPASDSGYASSKGEGEQLVREAFPTATVVRPSVLFGDDDKFVSLFAGLIAALPALPVFGAESRLQPLFVDDAAEAIVNALADSEIHGGKTYEIAGPEILTVEELHHRISKAQGRERVFFRLPDAIAALFAVLPGTPMNSDQWKLLKRGNVASGQLPGCDKLGVQPKPLGLFLDRWMMRYRKHGRFGTKNELA
ncbi:complex I NDUFA9 subunit family protein [Croceibacterium sp. LX-88]|uniref:Complex I NDUFA9 subunit family protein n=1 Tax=Croceibacterium selenioxidans TaxID=2838833 RepID=A0ABS5W6B4_9SPHN|nr:complex I NDUFA9 subunit family protein [Croceibacterium selenioxidans]MBT2135031.1 complex I NDUFA9 subunit family protein [Croceibacterium selenioxidans]